MSRTHLVLLIQAFWGQLGCMDGRCESAKSARHDRLVWVETEYVAPDGRQLVTLLESSSYKYFANRLQVSWSEPETLGPPMMFRVELRGLDGRVGVHSLNDLDAQLCICKGPIVTAGDGEVQCVVRTNVQGAGSVSADCVPFEGTADIQAANNDCDCLQGLCTCVATLDVALDAAMTGAAGTFSGRIHAIANDSWDKEQCEH